MYNYLGQKGDMAGGNQMGFGARPKTSILRPRHAEEVSGISFPLSNSESELPVCFDSGNKALTVAASGSLRVTPGREWIVSSRRLAETPIGCALWIMH